MVETKISNHLHLQATTIKVAKACLGKCQSRKYLHQQWHSQILDVKQPISTVAKLITLTCKTTQNGNLQQ